MSVSSLPQNPYISVLVEASAGTGKTYQLSRRFLYLVAAGAMPRSILTITFTVKSASEMRNRIIAEATRLLTQESWQEEFDQQMAFFYREAKKQQSHLLPPFSAFETARRILAATQSLKISTIDGLFNEWLCRFPWEAGLDEDGTPFVSYPFKILDGIDLQEMEKKVWKDLFKSVLSTENPQMLESVIKSADKGALTIELELKELDRHHTYLWQIMNQSRPGFRLHAFQHTENVFHPTYEERLIEALAVDLKIIAQQLKNPDDFFQGIHKKNFYALFATKVFTKAGTISKIYIKGQKRDAIFDSIERVESSYASYQAIKSMSHLNQMGLAYYDIYLIWSRLWDKHKKQTGSCSFTDLSKAAYRLFKEDSGLGATFLIQKNIQHVMIDEFQDTSLLQWGIFEKLKTELLSGFGLSSKEPLPSTAFIVGDRKQSIYGFREADPVVLDLAEETFNTFAGKKAALHQSFRSTQVILDVVSHFFMHHIDSDFPVHVTAKKEDVYVLDDVGYVQLLKPKTPSTSDENNHEDGLLPLEEEAETVAAMIAEAAAHPHHYPVYDRQIGGFRPFRTSDCCILYRNATHAGVFEDALRKKGIASRKEEKKGFFDRWEIRDLQALLRTIAFPYDVHAFSIALKSPFSGLSDAAYLQILEEAYKHQNETKENLSQGMWLALSKNQKSLFDTFTKLLQQAQQKSCESLVWQLFHFFRIFSVIEESCDDQHQNFCKQNLLVFLELVQSLCKDAGMTLAALSQRLEQLAALDEMGTAPSSHEGVTMMTIHKAKGLEFPMVFVVEAFEPWFKTDRYWIKGPPEDPGIYYIGRKDEQPLRHAPFDALKNRQTAALEAEAARLLYVAMTRASQYLIFSGHISPRKPLSRFYHGLLDTLGALGASEEKDRLVLARSKQEIVFKESFSKKMQDFNPSLSADAHLFFKPVGEVLSDVVIISPHAQKDHSGSLLSLSSELSPLSAFIGTFIHKGLELYLKKRHFDPIFWWKRIVVSGAKTKSLRVSEEAYLLAVNELSSALSSFDLKDLVASSQSVATELPLLYYQKGILMRGSCDALFYLPNERYIVIDFKTSLVDDTVDLNQWILEKGFDKQLAWYQKAIRSLYPTAKEVRAGVFLTKLGRVIWKSHGI